MFHLLSYLLSFAVTLSPAGRAVAEIPDSILGRKVCMASKVVSISDPGEAVAGQLSEGCVPVYFVKNGGFIEVRQPSNGPGVADNGLFRRYKPLSTTDSSTKVDITDLFLTEFSQLKSYPSTAYNSNNGTVMRTHIPLPDRTKVISCFTTGRATGAICDISYNMEGHIYGMFKVEGDFKLRCRIAKFFFIPEEREFPLMPGHKDAGVLECKRFSSPEEGKPIVEERFMCRRNISHGICYAIDTLMPLPWQAGIRKAVAEWNRGFSLLGLGEPLSCRSCSTLEEDLMADCFMYVPSGMENFECTLLTEPGDCMIHSSSTILHSSYISKLSYQYMAQAAVADGRARTTSLPDDVVTDIVEAVALHTIGRSLGLVENPGASFAAPADSLKSGSFTSGHGVTLSVMETPVFNFLAPEDALEKGVSLVQTCLGSYDLFALATLYKPQGNVPDGPDQAAAPSAIAQAIIPSDGIRFSPRKDANGDFIPYAIRGDLSSEPIAALDVLAERQKVLASNLDTWFEDAQVRDRVRSEAQDCYSRLMVRLTDYLSGKHVEGPSAHEAVDAVLRHLRNLGWMDDKDKEMMYGRNIFRQMITATKDPEILTYIYENIRHDETEWLDLMVTQLDTQSRQDLVDAPLATASYDILRRMRKEVKSRYLRKRLDVIL